MNHRFLILTLLAGVLSAVNVQAQNKDLGALSVVPDKKGENPMPPAGPQDSEAVVKDGLSITLAPAKAVFKAKEPLAFVITLKNVSKEPFMLFDADWAMGYALAIESATASGPWEAHPTFEVQRLPTTASLSKVVQPGATLEIKLPLDKYAYAFTGPQNMTPRPLPYLDPGKYRIRAKHQFIANPVLFLWPHKHWLGKLAAKPVEFTVAADTPDLGPVINKGLPDTLNGLSITVKPARTSFVLKEQLSFTVSFKNVSKKTLLLYDIDETMGYKIEFNGFPACGP